MSLLSYQDKSNEFHTTPSYGLPLVLIITSRHKVGVFKMICISTISTLVIPSVALVLDQYVSWSCGHST